MAQTFLHRIQLPKATLASIPDADRRLVVLFGNMANELQTLTRLLLFSLHQPWPDEAAERIATGRAQVVLRLLCGKLWEAHELVRKRIESDAVGRRYGNALKGEAGDCYKRIRQQAGGEDGAILAKLRNEHAFHYPSDSELDAAFSALPEQEPLEMYLSPNGDATHYAMADIVIELATMGVAQEASLEGRVNRVADIVIKSTADLVEFASHVIGAILDEHTTVLHSLPPKHVFEAAYLETTVIPPVTVRRGASSEDQPGEDA